MGMPRELISVAPYSIDADRMRHLAPANLPMQHGGVLVACLGEFADS
jgi:hypothetical protein